MPKHAEDSSAGDRGQLRHERVVRSYVCRIRCMVKKDSLNWRWASPNPASASGDDPRAAAGSIVWLGLCASDLCSCALRPVHRMYDHISRAA